MIAVVGSINLDLVVVVDRHPAPGETVVGGDCRQLPGGKGANQAVAAARLGAQVAMVGRVGADAQGAWLREGLWTEGVEVEHVREDRQAPTGVAMIAVDARGENTIVVSPGANARVDARDVAAASDVVRGAEVVLVQHEVPAEAVAAAIATAGGTVVLNPAPARGLAAPVDVLVPNRGELETLAGGRGDPVTLARSIAAARAVVVTLGEEGAVVVEGDRAERVRAPHVEAVDTTGAGDAFCGALAEALAGGATVLEAARWAVRVAAVSVTRPGPRAACRGARTCRRASSLIDMSVDSPEELEGLRRAGALAARVLREVREAVAPDVSTGELDALAAEILASEGGRSGPIITYDFPGAICISIGDEAVHGIPGPRRVKAGDLVKLDVAVELDGYFGDTATTVAVEPVSGADERLIAATRAALKRGMAAATAGARLRDVGAAVERIAEARGFSVLRELTGHGIGRGLHEAPTIYNYAHEAARARLHEGLVVTIEPMIATGTRNVLGTADGWTVVTANGANSAHEEHTIVVTAGEPIVLTAA